LSSLSHRGSHCRRATADGLPFRSPPTPMLRSSISSGLPAIRRRPSAQIASTAARSSLFLEPSINPPPRTPFPDHTVHTAQQRSAAAPPSFLPLLSRGARLPRLAFRSSRGAAVRREGIKARCSSRASASRAPTCGTARRRSSRSTGTTRRSWCTRPRTAPPAGSSAPSPSSTTSGPAPPSPSSGTYGCSGPSHSLWPFISPSLPPALHQILRRDQPVGVPS
jgi:hypothetical protein